VLQKIGLDDLQSAVLTMDEKIVSENMLRILLNFGIPSPEDAERVAAYLKTGKLVDLSKPDAWLHAVHPVPHLDARLRSFLLLLRFGTKCAEARPGATVILKALTQLSESKHLPVLLEVVLMLGNFLNSGSFRGNACGVKLDAFTKLAEVKSRDGKSSLMHFFVKVIQERHPAALAFASELSAIPEAARISFLAAKAEVAELRKELNTVDSGVRTIADDAVPEGDPWKVGPFVAKMTEFIELSRKNLAEVEGMYSLVETEFEQVSVLYGEDPKTIGIDDFLALFQKFVVSFTKCQKELAKAKEPSPSQRRFSNSAASPTGQRRHSVYLGKESQQSTAMEALATLERFRQRKIQQEAATAAAMAQSQQPDSPLI
jgi:hypothetical protein